jgi:hypothetical protein
MCCWYPEYDVILQTNDELERILKESAIAMTAFAWRDWRNHDKPQPEIRNENFWLLANQCLL